MAKIEGRSKMKVHFDPPTALKMALLTMMPIMKPTAKPLFWKRLRAQGQDTFELCIPLCSLCLSVLGISSLESDVGMKTKVPALRFRHQFRSSSYECRDPMEFPCQVDSRHSSLDIQHSKLKKRSNLPRELLSKKSSIASGGTDILVNEKDRSAIPE